MDVASVTSGCMKLVSTVVVIVSDSMHYLIVCLNSHCIVVHRLEMYRQRYINNYSIVFFSCRQWNLD